jgi:signal transduction histidine kinase/CheY-like chemotaxis protein
MTMDQADGRLSVSAGLTAEQIFPGESEMARLMRATDWARTPLGPAELWSPSLRIMVRYLLPNRFPLLLWWGPEFLQLYNDAYRPVLGTKHPQYLGRPVRECWSEIWDVIGPLIETPFRGGPATWMEDISLEVNRYGFLEETHFTIGYSPVPDDTVPTGIGGVLATVHEISEKVVGERRVVVLRDLGARSAEAKSAEEACQIAAGILAHHAKDLPFALLYLIDADGRHARLAAAAGVAQGAAISPLEIALDGDACEAAGVGAAWPLAGVGAAWPLAEVVREERMRVIEDLPARFDAVPPGPWSDPPTTAVVTPIHSTIAHQLAGLLVAGVSARLRFDDVYAGFFELVAGQLAAAIANARAYEEERRRAEALAAIDRAKTIFFSNVSHEFRTPLTLMLGPVADSLADAEEPLPPRQRERIEVVRRNGGRLLKLVNTLLDFSRIEAGRVQATYEPINLPTYTVELASAFRSLVEKTGLALNVDCPPLDGLAAPVYVDREMWEKIVLNLLSNAFKFTFDGSIAVTLRAVDGGQAVELSVRDTGVGIPAAEQPRLFERFRRVEGARARTYEGSGIGLALVQELVHLHGGTIRAESAEGAGTAFYVRIPTGTAHLPADRIQARSKLATTALGAEVYVEEAERWLPDDTGAGAHEDDTGTRWLAIDADAGLAGAAEGERPARIVLADDNADMRNYLRRLLGERYAVEAFGTGTAALAAIERQVPDLVLSDVMMPELDGFGLLKALRAEERTRALPVILLSARAGEEATVEGMQAGADDYLVKPFSAWEVLSRVAGRLEIARTRAEAERRLDEALSALMSMAEALVGDAASGMTSQEQGSTRAAGSAAELDTLDTGGGTIRQLLGLTRRVLDAHYAGASYIDSETGAFDLLAVVGLSAEVEQRLRRDLSHRRMSDYYPPEALARLNAEEIVAFDSAEAPPISGQDYYGLGNVLIVPARMDARHLLVVAVEARYRPAFTAQERELARTAVRLVQLVIERERLLREREEGRLRELALTEATRRMDEFLGIASHELRTPLTSVIANVQLAERQLRRVGAGADSADDSRERMHLLQERMERMVAQLKRLDRLVGDLLDTSRIEAGRLEMQLERCDLAEVVRQAVQEARAVWPSRSITLELPRRKSLAVMADADRIGQVVTNYLTNALKYSAEAEPVAVCVRPQEGSVRVEVRDCGPGLTAGQQERLFERFYRVPGIMQQSGSGVGLGLGLHICKTIVERHVGRVGVESAMGAGCTFWFTLPLAHNLPDEA